VVEPLDKKRIFSSLSLTVEINEVYNSFKMTKFQYLMT